MRLLVLAFLGAVAVGLLACGVGPGGGCCGFTTIKRDVAYVGTIPSTDGGTPTRVEVTVSASGATTLSFTNDGRTILYAGPSQADFGP